MEFTEQFKEYLESIGAREQILSMIDRMTQLENSNEQLREQVSGLSENNTALQTQVADLNQRTVPVGTILSYGGRRESIPNGWLLCDGQWLNTDQNTALFAAIGHAWGKDSNNPQKFRIPDLRGRFLRGVDYEAGLDPNSKDRKNGEGLPDVGSMQGDSTKMPNNKFTGYANPNGKHSHTFVQTNAKQKVEPIKKSYNHDRWYLSSASHLTQNTSETPNHNHTVNINGGDAETRPKNAYVNYIIRVI